jgi:hypothetical protein
VDAEELYQKLKDALRLFGLSFDQKHRVKFFIKGQKVVFKYEDRAVEYDMLRENEMDWFDWC